MFLKYRLPAVARPPPLALRALSDFRAPDALRPAAAVTLVVQYAIRPQLEVDVRNVILDVDVHPLLGEPAKVGALGCGLYGMQSAMHCGMHWK